MVVGWARLGWAAAQAQQVTWFQLLVRVYDSTVTLSVGGSCLSFFAHLSPAAGSV